MLPPAVVGSLEFELPRTLSYVQQFLHPASAAVSNRFIHPIFVAYPLAEPSLSADY